MLVATIICYNDMPIIKDCINSIYDKVDKIIAIDGRFKDFPGQGWDSIDGTLEYLLGLDIDLISSYNADEVGKRNSYLNQLLDGDICLNIDTDEILVGSIPELTADIGIIQVGEKGDRKRHRRTIRFFKYREGLHYWGQHKMILDKDNNLFASLDRVGQGYTSQKITEFEFLHNNHKRGYNRKQDKKIYYQILMKREAKINEPVN